MLSLSLFLSHPLLSIFFLSIFLLISQLLINHASNQAHIFKKKDSYSYILVQETNYLFRKNLLLLENRANYR